LALFKKYKSTTLWKIGAFLDRNVAGNPLPTTILTKDTPLLYTHSSFS